MSQVTPSRFQQVAPLSGLPAVTVDLRWLGGSFADEVCRKAGAQGRVLWIDGTANLNRINTKVKIESLIGQIKRVGFNTVVLDVKPIVGRTLYPSKIAEKLTGWKGQTLNVDFDPVAEFRLSTRKSGLSFFVSMNAFSEGHSYAKRDEGKPDTAFGKAGWGYEHPELQSILYRAHPVVRFQFDSAAQWSLCKTINPKVWEEDCALFDRAPVPVVTGARYVVIDKAQTVAQVSGEAPTTVTDGSQVLVMGSVRVVEPVLKDSMNRLPRVGEKVVFDSVAVYERSSQEQDQIPLMMKPHDTVVQNRVLSLVKEVVQTYKPDGLLFDDRFRYHGIDADFSVTSRLAFEKSIGRKAHWPDEVFKWTMSGPRVTGIKPGPLFDTWLAWRASVLSNFADKVRQTVRKANATTQFGIYAGSWFGDYAKYGSNYASTALQAGFPFLTRSYQKTGLSEQLDVLITGCYYKTATMFDALGSGRPIGQTVEAAGDVSNRVAQDGCWVYAGIQLADFNNDPKGLSSALQAAAASTQGVMVFDLSHNIQDYWSVFERAFQRPMVAPHTLPNALQTIRRKRADWKKKGYPERPFPILEGSPGTGF